MMRKYLLSSAASLAVLTVLAAGSAMAADLSVAEAPVMPGAAPILNWSGFYVGLHGGGGWGSQNPNTPATFNIDGPYVGGQIGYNWQTSNIVFGLEADASWSGINGTRVAAFTTTEDLTWFGTVRGRLGYVFSNNWLGYITGGWAYGHGDRANSGFLGGTASASHSGWTAGLGAEWNLAQHWTAKAEYKYVDLGAANYTFTPGGGVSNVDLKFHTFELGLNYHF